MIAINLLPWRHEMRARLVRRKKYLILLCAIGVLLLMGLFRHVDSTAAVKPVADPPPRGATLPGAWHRIRFVGFVHAGTQIWALIVLPDGKTVDVREGDPVLEVATVKHIDETHLILQLPEHTQYVFSLAT